MAENSAYNSAADHMDAPPVMPVAGIAILAHFGLIHFSGEDAQAFLHGQVSCDVNALQPSHASYGSYSTPKGRMLASFLLWRDDTGFMLQLPRSLCEPVRKRLSMYILRSRVTARDASDDYVLLGLTGANAVAQLEPLFKTIPSTALAMSTAPHAHLLRLDATRFQIIASRDRGREIQNALVAHATPISAAAWDWTNVRAGIPYITPATQDQFVPQMANLDLINGVSFTKGCYPGQEIVARMHYLGKLKQRMYLATIAGNVVPQPGDKLYSADTGEQATGMIVNAAPSPDGGYAALAVMHIASFTGDDVHLKSPEGPRLNFIELPYKIPS
jgi:folate-binding protein YgfZ